MSARAAWRLESLHFAPVYRYTPSLADWSANGLPVEPRRRERSLAEVARREVPTCSLNDRVETARERASAAGLEECAVVNDAGILLGTVGPSALAGDQGALVGDVMDPGPVTHRLDDSAERVGQFLEERDLTRAIVTTTDGELYGMFFVADLRLSPAGASLIRDVTRRRERSDPKG